MNEMAIDLENREDFAAYIEALAMQAEEKGDEIVANFLHKVSKSLVEGTFEELSALVREHYKPNDSEDYAPSREEIQKLLSLIRGEV